MSTRQQKLPPPGGFARKAGEPEGRCPQCSFQPTSRNDFCPAHRPLRTDMGSLPQFGIVTEYGEEAR